MMGGIPRVALALAVAGLIPFVWGAATVVAPGFALPVAGWLPRWFGGAELVVRYGVVILCFMAGVFWGFAARAEGRDAAVVYVLSVIPALYILFNLGTSPEGTALSLLIGFAGVLAIDWHCWRSGLAPAWWMRVPVTGVVVLTLLPVVLG